MTTTGTTTFNPNLNDLFEEAFERCGAELRTGYDFRTARRSLNLLTIEWANRGINLWTIEQGSIALTKGTIQYNLPADTIDLVEQVVRTGTGSNQSDINITRISMDTYATIPTKNAQGRPIQVWIDRQSGDTLISGSTTYPRINVWPAPDKSDYYTFVYWRLRRIQDAGSGSNTVDIPFRFIPCLVAGLAYHLALKLPNAIDRVPLLKAEYEELWQQAADEDREKATLRIAPRQMYL